MARRVHRVRRTKEISAPRSAVAQLAPSAQATRAAAPGRAQPTRGQARKRAYLLEDINALRLSAGIEDTALAMAIRGLGVGDRVKLTFLAHPEDAPGEALAVRISSKHGLTFTGRLIGQPRSAGLAGLRVGARLRFTTAHIHSIVKF